MDTYKRFIRLQIGCGLLLRVYRRYKNNLELSFIILTLNKTQGWNPVNRMKAVWLGVWSFERLEGQRMSKHLCLSLPEMPVWLICVVCSCWRAVNWILSVSVTDERAYSVYYQRERYACVLQIRWTEAKLAFFCGNSNVWLMVLSKWTATTAWWNKTHCVTVRVRFLLCKNRD